MGKKIGVVLGLLFALILLPKVISLMVLLFGVQNFLVILLPVCIASFILSILLVKKKKWILLCYIWILSFFIITTGGRAVDMSNVLFYDVKGGFTHRMDILKKISDTEGMYLVELINNSTIRNTISKFNEEVAIDEKTFHYKKGENAKESIDFFIKTIDKYKNEFNKYLVYDNSYPLDIYFDRDLQGALGQANSYFIKVGFYDEFRSLGLEGFKGELEYQRVIIHEYIHGIMFSMIYNEDEKFKRFEEYKQASNLDELMENEPYTLPMWFIEGLAEYLSYEILHLEHEKGEITPVDLTSGKPIYKNISNTFYTASSRVVRELYKEVGATGIIKLINDSNTTDFDKVFKDVTGKVVEDYYYIFDEK